ncbi:ser thr phosphatase family protein [Cystoisospora suis]|uniref:Ser thr phosphatase family protein n=1 Tax=Cystoisospora suis TaxID=483139 RepID=A0A2C6L3X4_9APIC|nr:ser thr phosphatase family protein [Cystoisospora suis]
MLCRSSRQSWPFDGRSCFFDAQDWHWLQDHDGGKRRLIASYTTAPVRPQVSLLLLRNLALVSLSVGVLFLAAVVVPSVSTSEPLDFDWPGSRIVAIGDLHGDLGNTVLLLYGAGVVDDEGNWVGGDTLLIQTGDIVDRGPDGKRLYDFFVRLKRQAEGVGGRVIQLLGNHDVMNICGDFRYAHPTETKEFGGPGGRRSQFMDNGEYGQLLRTFPASVKVNGIIFSHAGIPSEYAGMGLRRLTEQLHKELKDDCKLHNARFYGEMVGGGAHSELFVAGSHGPLWTRVFSIGQMAVICKEVEITLSKLGAEKLVVGHTVQESGSIGAWCDGKLLLIDTGISRYVANQPKMLEIRGNTFLELGLEVAPQSDQGAPRVRGTKRRLSVPPLKVPVGKSAKEAGSRQRSGESRTDEL